VRLFAGMLVLVVLVARLGTGPFLDGLRLISVGSLVTATAITVVTTLCCAWRWRLVAGGLGVQLGPWTAVAAVYRAQFLNATLPGGVLGDADRAVGHGRAQHELGRGATVAASVRSVVWERALGQVVQVALTIVVLVALPSPMRAVGGAACAAAVVALVAVLMIRMGTGRSTGLIGRVTRVIGADLRGILRTRRARAGVGLASAAAATGHLVVFLVAARAAGVHTSTTTLLPIAAVVLLVAAVPVNVAGWGPREGFAAWAFGAAGLGVSTGVTTAVVYGVMAFVATLPGAVVLLAGRRIWFRPMEHTPSPVLEEVARG
jgi:uncharacterized membrane protein YbhN (UPF0104 family)